MALCYNTVGKNEPTKCKEEFMSRCLIKTQFE